MRPWRQGPPVIALALAAAGCLDTRAAFVCQRDDQCDPGGVCLNSACARGDQGCPSGYRYTDTAGPRTGMCAEVADLAVIDLAVVEGDAATCGNGHLDPGELCDPGDGSVQGCPQPSECDDSEPCTNDFVEGDPCRRRCVHDYQGFGESAPCGFDGGVKGLCRGNRCCVGCWNGQYCEGGKAAGACGGSGGKCANCAGSDGGVDCQTPSCNLDGTCRLEATADGIACAGGRCAAGKCCTGCVGGGGCQPGNQAAACGSGGVACSDCKGSPCGRPDGGVGYACQGCQRSCVNKECGNDGCGGDCGTCPMGRICDPGGRCVCGPVGKEDNDTACGNGRDDDCDGRIDCADADCVRRRCAPVAGSFCNQALCAAGCLINGALQPKGAAEPNNLCRICNPAVNDTNWSAASEGSACKAFNGASGQCRRGTCCTGCWDGNQCVGNLSAEKCGRGGVACVKCVDANPCHYPSCNGGTCGYFTRDGQPCPGLCDPLNCACPNGAACLQERACKAGNCVPTQVRCCPNLTRCNVATGACG